MIRAGIRRMKRLWAADSLQDCAHEILIVVKFGSTLSARPLSAAYMSSQWCELFRGKMFPRFSPIFLIRFYFILAIWLSNNLSVRLTKDCFWMVFFFSFFVLLLPNCLVSTLDQACLQPKSWNPKMRVNPMNSKRPSLRYAWNTFLGTSAVRMIDFASDVFFFCLDGP